MSEQDDEAVQGDLAEHERPVVGEDLVERRAGEPRRAEAVVDPAGDRSGGSTATVAHGRSQKPGPTGSVKSPWATQEALVVDGQGQLRQRAGGGAEARAGRRRARRRSTGGTGRAAPWCSLLVEADRAADVGADLRVGDVALGGPRLPALAGGDVGVGQPDEHRLRVLDPDVALGEDGDRAADLERVDGDGVALLVDDPGALAPPGVEEVAARVRAERADREQRRDAERRPRRDRAS